MRKVSANVQMCTITMEAIGSKCRNQVDRKALSLVSLESLQRNLAQQHLVKKDTKHKFKSRTRQQQTLPGTVVLYKFENSKMKRMRRWIKKALSIRSLQNNNGAPQSLTKTNLCGSCCSL